MRKPTVSAVRSCLFVGCLLALCAPSVASAQTLSAGAALLHPVAQTDRVGVVNRSAMTALPGHLPTWVNRANLSATALNRTEAVPLTLLLRRSPDAEQAFQQQLEQQQTPGSPLYHRAVSPEDLGHLYGPTDHDLAAVQQWIQSAGLTVVRVSPSRTAIEVTGSLDAVEAAFHVHFSMYDTEDGAQRGPDAEPLIPEALRPLVAAVSGLTVEHPHPAFTGSRGGHFLTPADFATIYNVTPVYASGNNGAMIGSVQQRVAVAATSAADANQIQAFLAGIGRSNANYKVVLATGNAVGYTASEGEAELDVERVLGTAPGVAVDLVEAPTIYAAAYYAVNTLHDPIVNVSFGQCEQSLGAANAQRWQDLWATAASNMVSVFVSGGDAGAAACGQHGNAPPATQFRAINGYCSSAYNTCVGGTEFNDTADPTQYWSTTNDPTTKRSALGYIPEGAWNEPTTTDSNGNTTYRLQAGGGGVSTLVAKPAWQTGSGVPADGFRDIPDISFSAAGHDGYFTCAEGHCDPNVEANPNTFVAYGYYGTSASSPSMAGIAALLNTAAGAPQGLLNPVIYKLANSAVAAQVFHDVTLASSGVTNCDVSVPSLCNNSTPATNSLTGGQAGFAVGTGYDLATGWGSLNVANFIQAALPVSTSLALTANGTAIGVSQSIVVQATLTPKANSLAAPTGTVQFLINGAAASPAVALSGANTASATLTFPAAGSYTVTAVYSGDALYTTSSAGAVTILVAAQPPSFTLTPGATSLSFVSGTTTGNSTSITATGVNNFAGMVSFACSVSTSSAAFQPTCAVSPATGTLAANGTATTTLMITSTAAQAAVHSLEWRPAAESHSGVVLAGTLALLFVGLRRRLSVRLLVFVTAAGAASLLVTGCGNSGSSAPKRSSAGTYTVTVTATGTAMGALAPSSATTAVQVVIQ